MTIRQKDPRFKNLEIKTGIMVVIAILGVALVMAFIGLEKDLFSAKYRVYFISESGSGFVEGMPVKLSGFRIGRVKKIELTEDARVRIVAELNRKYERWIRDDSVARLSKEGLIGDPYVEVTAGNAERRMLVNNDAIQYVKEGGMEELVEKAKPVLNEIKDIIHYVNDPDGDIKVMLSNLKELSVEVRETRRAVDATLKDAGKSIRDADRLVLDLNDRTKSLIDNADRTITRLDPVITRIEDAAGKAGAAIDRFPETMEKVERIADNVRLLTDALAKETPRIREMLVNADETLWESKEMVKGVKESWPVRLMIPPAKGPELVPLDGYLLNNGKSAPMKKAE
ncbi:MAG: hypothetical protein A2X99_08300 [Deltaproteobacteria bacterium GWB2_55_19]|nr:MAG: hypothetical protein A2X99_08300 [Deltaproteobacteria bacterium GWB2_55_19]HAO94231.1 hypothetical protein [Deltaproteobacteria bacterium]